METEMPEYMLSKNAYSKMCHAMFLAKLGVAAAVCALLLLLLDYRWATLASILVLSWALLCLTISAEAWYNAREDLDKAERLHNAKQYEPRQ